VSHCTARLAVRRRQIRVLTRDETRRGRGPGGPPPRNPFLPYDEALWVAHLSASHTLLLNKFNVVRHHLLVVTRAFEPQAAPLTAGDLGATWRVMQARRPRTAPCWACVEGARPCPAAWRVVCRRAARGWQLCDGQLVRQCCPHACSGRPMHVHGASCRHTARVSVSAATLHSGDLCRAFPQAH